MYVNQCSNLNWFKSYNMKGKFITFSPVAQNEWKKTQIYIFSTFGSKINEFERKKLEKPEKIPKT